MSVLARDEEHGVDDDNVGVEHELELDYERVMEIMVLMKLTKCWEAAGSCDLNGALGWKTINVS